jgi:hypothetical protein
VSFLFLRSSSSIERAFAADMELFSGCPKSASARVHWAMRHHEGGTLFRRVSFLIIFSIINDSLFVIFESRLPRWLLFGGCTVRICQQQHILPGNYPSIQYPPDPPF